VIEVSSNGIVSITDVGTCSDSRQAIESIEQSISSRGACLVQGILSDIGLRQKWPETHITESHPKALLAVWPPISELIKKFKFSTEHERDAFIGAYAAWQYIERNPSWKNWVLEENDVYFPSGHEVAYWFPDE
jgi:hypothetical protein